MRLVPSLLVATLAAGSAQAQLGITVGPELAPVDCPVQITISNDTTSAFSTGICPFEILDAGGTKVFPGPCIEIAVQIPAGDTLVLTWDQTDLAGQPVPPGTYQVNVALADGTTQTTFVTIDPSVDAALVSLGVTKTGTNRALSLCAPGAGNQTYLAAASLGTSTGIPTCAGTFPLNADGIFQTSVTPGNPFFLNFVGTLDASGHSADPAISVPADASLVGVGFFTGFVTVDPTQPCIVSSISEPLAMTIQ